MEENKVPAGYIESKYVLPIYEHIDVNKQSFVKIKYFIGYQVVLKKSKERHNKHLEKAVLKVKVLTGSDAGMVYDGKYIYATDGAYQEDFMLMFANENCNDKVYLYDRDGEHLLHDDRLDRNLWTHVFMKDGRIGASNRIVMPEYVTAKELQEIQDRYNQSTQTLIDIEKSKNTIKTDSIF